MRRLLNALQSVLRCMVEVSGNQNRAHRQGREDNCFHRQAARQPQHRQASPPKVSRKTEGPQACQLICRELRVDVRFCQLRILRMHRLKFGLSMHKSQQFVMQWTQVQYAGPFKTSTSTLPIDSETICRNRSNAEQVLMFWSGHLRSHCRLILSPLRS